MIYGGGVLETLSAINGKMLYFERHYSRLKHSLKTLYPKVSLSITQNDFWEAFNELMVEQTKKMTNKISPDSNQFRVNLKVFLDNDTKLFHCLMEVSPYYLFKHFKVGMEVGVKNNRQRKSVFGL